MQYPRFLSFLQSTFAGSIFILLCLIVNPANILAQSSGRIGEVDFFVRNDSMFIDYAIEEAGKRDLFEVSIKLISKSGKEFFPAAIIGDIGKGVTGGKGKRAIWALETDRVLLNEEVSVEVSAMRLTEITTHVSRGKAMLLSAIVPGLGIQKLRQGGAWWLFSVGVYGCLAGSLVSDQLAKENYRKYETSMVTDERNSLHSTVIQQQNISRGLIYTAGALWLGNMIWTLATPNKTKKQEKGWTISPSYDPLAGTPIISVKIGL